MPGTFALPGAVRASAAASARGTTLVTGSQSLAASVVTRPLTPATPTGLVHLREPRQSNGRCVPGADLTARPEPSVGCPDRTDRRRPRTRTAGTPAPAAPAGEPDGPAESDPLLTIDEVITELRISRAAFYRWRRRGTGPATVRLPGGGLRIRRSALRQWLRRLEDPSREEPAA